MTTEVLIVGAGPAGAACAGELQRRGIPFLLLDKATFPRDKTCAGWITPAVLRTLGLSPAGYPYGLKEFDRFVIHLPGRRLLLPVKQYAIRRIEFDRFLLEHYELSPIRHAVRTIREEAGYFVADDRYRGRWLVGAGGAYCPVAAHFFPERKSRKERWISAIETEFPCAANEERCHLWFRLPGLPGYAWAVPKAGGYLNIGIGGYTQQMKARGTTIRQHWEAFLQRLKEEGLVETPPAAGKGYNYMIRSRHLSLQKGRVLLTGDAAGLATPDMGEGIGPALESGLLAARAIAEKKQFTPRRIRRRSFPFPGLPLRLGWKAFFG